MNKTKCTTEGCKRIARKGYAECLACQRAASAMKSREWMRMGAEINAAIADGFVINVSTAFGLFQIASVSYNALGMSYKTTGSWLDARTFVCHGGHFAEWSSAARAWRGQTIVTIMEHV